MALAGRSSFGTTGYVSSPAAAYTGYGGYTTSTAAPQVARASSGLNLGATNYISSAPATTVTSGFNLGATNYSSSRPATNFGSSLNLGATNYISSAPATSFSTLATAPPAAAAAARPAQYAQAAFTQAPHTYSPYAAINEKIVRLVGEPGSKFLKELKPFFEEAAGGKMACAFGRGRLDYWDAVRFFETASTALVGVTLGAQHLSEIEFIRFDFDGDGTLSFDEAAKCLRNNLFELQKEIGFKTVIPVPEMTPEQGGYTVVKILASGGQGSTALAKTAEGTSVALKIYDKANANAGGIEDLRGEMEVMKTLEGSAQIMTCLEIFQDQDHYYCVNELMPGGDLTALRDKAKRAGVALTESYFQGIFTQCIAALDYMHANAMMHCDIKEPNIMIKNTDYARPEVALIDFGLTKGSGGDGQSGGTPGYMPPEFFNLQVWLPRGDIFCMGVVFFQLLADMTPDEAKQKSGLFTENLPPVYTQDDMMMAIAQSTMMRQPDYRRIHGQYPGVMSFLPFMMEKDFRLRPKAPQLMAEPWFNVHYVPKPTASQGRGGQRKHLNGKGSGCQLM